MEVSGKEIGRSTLTSAKGNLSIHVKPEKEEAKVGNIVYVDIDIADENGIVETNADAELTVEVMGGSLLGFGSCKSSDRGTV